MGNLVNTYQLIADILSFENPYDSLNGKLQNQNIDWDNFVKQGSKQLVLPALYCKLQSAKLLHHLPKELEDYLEKLTSINRNRNTSIIDQAVTLSKVFKQNNINHVFLKGTALLASKYYKDNAVRMVGDIDVLISKRDIKKAYELIKTEGYKVISPTLGNDFFEHKHLPRLIPNTDLCAVELHTKLFSNYKIQSLNPKNILANKNPNTIVNVPSNEHLLLHSILNHQINDNGHLYKTINFRTAYDTLTLLKQEDFFYLKETFKMKTFRSYFKRLSLLFKESEILSPFLKNLKSFNFIKYNQLHRFYIKLIKIYSLISIIFNRLGLFITNSTYRTAVLNDKSRIINLFKDKLLLKK